MIHHFPVEPNICMPTRYPNTCHLSSHIQMQDVFFYILNAEPTKKHSRVKCAVRCVPVYSTTVSSFHTIQAIAFRLIEQRLDRLTL